MSVSLYFNTEIEKIVLGEPVNFLTEKELGDSEVVLRYSPLSNNEKDQTNLTVITIDGKVYEFLLNLGETPGEFNIPVPVQDAIMNLAPDSGAVNTAVDVNGLKIVEAPLDYNKAAVLGENTGVQDSIAEEPKMNLYHTNKKEYFRKKIYYHQYDKNGMSLCYARFDKVFLWLENVKYNTNEIYLFFRLENKESSDYDIGSIAYSIGTIKKKNNSFQKIPMPPIYRYNLPKRIKGGDTAYFVLVFEKFSLDKKKALVIDFDELNGDET